MLCENGRYTNPTPQVNNLGAGPPVLTPYGETIARQMLHLWAIDYEMLFGEPPSATLNATRLEGIRDRLAHS